MKPLAGAVIQQVLALSSEAWDKIYDGHAEIIKLENNGQLNEKLLIHGTKPDGADGIVSGNFDNRYYSYGAFGYGAYFAEDPNYSNGFTAQNA